MKFQHKGVHSLEQLSYVQSAISKSGGKSTESLFLAENAVMQGLPEAECFLETLMQTVRQVDVKTYLMDLQERLKFVRAQAAFPAIMGDAALLARLYAPQGYLFLPADKPTDKLLVIFTTIYNNYQLSNALMLAMLRPLGVSVLFLKDDTYKCYLGGVASFGETIEDTAQRIVRLAESEGLQRVYITGFSSGGYASLYAASLIPCTAYLGLSVYVDWQSRSSLPRRLRFSPIIEEKLSSSAVGLYQRNLKPLVANRPGTFPIILCYGEQSIDDQMHAMEMASVSGVEVRCFMGAGHGLVGHLMRTGELDGLFEELIAIAG